MEFSSITFLFLFLPFTMIAYFCTKKAYRNLVIFIANLVFYAWIEPVFFILLVFIMVLDYTSGRLIDRYRERATARLVVLIITIIINLLFFLFFKYSLFIPQVEGLFGVETGSFKNVILPIGLSIYILQGLSYVLDLYMKKIRVQRSFIDLGAYIAFFPQLICGPILRYSDMRIELVKRDETLNKAATGYSLFIKGLAKKMFLGDILLSLWYSIKALDTIKLSALTAWIGIIAFALAMYFYFSGYSDMSRGIGKILGFEIPANFNYPYISKNISEFSRRFNISLTSWVKTYVFTPLASRSDNLFLTSLKLLTLWILVGLWYGGAINFLLWGVYIGAIIIAERLFLLDVLKKLPVFFQRIYTMLFVLLGWVIFEMDTLPQIISYYSAMFTAPFIDSDAISLYYLGRYLPALVVAIFCSSNVWHSFVLKLELKNPNTVKWSRIFCDIILTLLCFICAIANQHEPLNFFVRF